ncbi:unnamed protein product [Camellia sinensis]
MSGEEEGTWKFDDWSSLVDFPKDGLWGDLISDANIDLFIPIDQWPWSPTLNLSGLLQHINTTNTPAGNTTSLSTSSYLSLLAKFSKSTLKCRCRTLEIEEWPSCKRNKVKPVDEFVPGAGANNPALSTSPSLLDQPKPPGSELQREKGKSLCYRTEVGFRQVERLLDHMPGGYHNELRVQIGNLQEFGKMIPKENLFIGVTNEQCSKVAGSSQLVFQPTRPNPSVAHCKPDAILSTLPETPSRDLLLIRSSEGFSENAMLGSMVPNVTTRQDMSTLIVKATYREDMIRFRFLSNFEIIELKNKKTNRLPLKVGTFNIQYEDDNHELILMACDEDLQECMDIWTLLGNNKVRLFIHDKITTSRIACESRGVKRKQTY